MTAVPTTTVGILIFDDVEVLDFCGPFEVFSVATTRGDGGGEPRPLYRALTIAERPGIVRCVGGLLVQPQHTIADHPPLDLLVVPGGRGTRRERTNPVLLDWIVSQDRRAELTASVCTGSFLLAAAGLLDGKRATTHWGSIAWLREHYPGIEVLDDARFVDEGRIVTSAGISAGIDMALHILRDGTGSRGRVDGAADGVRGARSGRGRVGNSVSSVGSRRRSNTRSAVPVVPSPFWSRSTMPMDRRGEDLSGRLPPNQRR
jgi:transcriptional regulator GlxA family with amidase domain